MAEGSSPALCMRLRSSRQESPASTRMRVRLLATIVLLPLDPEASTVMRIIRSGYAPCVWKRETLKEGLLTLLRPRHRKRIFNLISVKSASGFTAEPAGIDHTDQ